MGNDDDPVARGRSSYHVRQGLITLAIGPGFLVAQGLAYLFGWTGSVWLPFSPVAAAVILLGLATLVYSRRAPCCRFCRVGLEPSIFGADAAERALPALRIAFEHRDAHAIVAAVEANPCLERDKRIVRVRLEYCPSCVGVASVWLESFTTRRRYRDWPGPQAVSGDGVRAILGIANTIVD